mmetsp:Transcript_44281/g.172332  ORF Transcript_44281/g.172332 Transcript_44281/m.172332 type:complete len:624 (-) Transcript_44281:145-2016(-)|eukprot:CAMPEP_0113958450 /NCGR_PEP_ID=MMETSP0011_2-20120614/3432_1 /TAXON_ID=101924 /ORGANISM="Rhodosorus marinus" /LENGTH=623 /DNA_ID=CAMNT_0000969325 /DNA_START=349 /DNA_END=2220 /DNA_ORIENTATION=- /assembly_acc=CAM_ASM_000156
MALESRYLPVMVEYSFEDVQLPGMSEHDLSTWRMSLLAMDSSGKYMYVAGSDGCIREFLLERDDTAQRNPLSRTLTFCRSLRYGIGNVVNQLKCYRFDDLGDVLFAACGEAGHGPGNVMAIQLGHANERAQDPRGWMATMPDSAWGISAHPGRRALAVSCNAPSVRLFTILSPASPQEPLLAPSLPHEELVGHLGNIPCVAFTPNGRHLLSCSLDGSIFLWDWERAEIVSICDLSHFNSMRTWGWFVQYVPYESVKRVGNCDKFFALVEETGRDDKNSYSNALRLFWTRFGESITCAPVCRVGVTRESFALEDLADAYQAAAAPSYPSIVGSLEQRRPEPASSRNQDPPPPEPLVQPMTSSMSISQVLADSRRPVRERADQVIEEVDDVDSCDDLEVVQEPVTEGSLLEVDECEHSSTWERSSLSEQKSSPLLMKRSPNLERLGPQEMDMESDTLDIPAKDMIVLGRRESLVLVRASDRTAWLAELSPLVPKEMEQSGAIQCEHEANRISMAEYVPELSLVVACIQGSGIIVLVRIVRMVENGTERFAFVTEAVLSRSVFGRALWSPRRDKTIVGFSVTRTPSEHPSLTHVDVHIIRENGYYEHFVTSRRPASLAVDFNSTSV